MTAEKIIIKIEEIFSQDFSKGMRNTQILNMEYTLGKYHAYMEILEVLDFNKWMEIHKRFKLRVEELMMEINNLYK